MSARFFLDTNVFVYTFDHSAPLKRKRAEQLVAEAMDGQAGVISSQVVQEFLNVATRKFSPAMKPAEARAYLDTVLIPLCEIFPSAALYQQTLQIQAETGFSFYDSLMVAAALEADCATLYSEDLQHDRRLHGLAIINPF
ncbi:MAG TPA: PIN domain-containing protein [Candidatus Limnocylindria bacterium]|jgi:predicted nucleic acid-binding protein|nr:PIN domain-containing protein [Candidatus Limnocylindria bacterium]